jgi:fatty acid desaturase
LEADGLLRRNAVRYLPYALILMALLVISGLILSTSSGIGSMSAGAVLLTLAFIQIVFLAHDASHNQVFRSRTRNRLLLHLLSFILGTSALWWLDKHTRHHAVPNQDGIDSDIDLPLLAFSREQARNKQGLARIAVRHQAWLLLPMMPLEGFWPQLESAMFLLRRRPSGFRTHLLALLGHHAVLLAVLVLLVGLWPALAVGLAAHSLFGVYMVLAFVPNHTAMPISEGRLNCLSFMQRQMLTTRNVATNSLGDILFGGLNFQIEHHLFPYLPRHNLRKASRIVRKYVEDAGLTYQSCGPAKAYGEVFRHMRAMSRAA